MSSGQAAQRGVPGWIRDLNLPARRPAAAAKEWPMDLELHPSPHESAWPAPLLEPLYGATDLPGVAAALRSLGLFDVNAAPNARLGPVINHAARDGQVRAVQLLLKAGAVVNTTTVQPPLHAVMGSAAPDAVALAVGQVLVAGGADVTFLYANATPLRRACATGKVQCVKWILMEGGAAAKADAQAQDGLGQTPAMLAVKCGAASDRDTAAVCTALSEFGSVSLTAPAFPGKSLLLNAVRAAKPETVDMLLRAGASATEADMTSRTALHLAMWSPGDDAAAVTMAKALVGFGADVNAVAGTKDTALHSACQLSRASVVEWLLSAGARADVRNAHGSTPLLVLAESTAVGAADVFVRAGDALRRAGCGVDVADHSGRTALHVACDRGALAAVRWLLEAGACPTACDSEGITPLALCASSGAVQCLRAVLAAGGDLSCVDAKNYTLLHHAASYHRKDMLLQLVTLGGSSLTATAMDGRTPVDYLVNTNLPGHLTAVAVAATAAAAATLTPGDAWRMCTIVPGLNELLHLAALSCNRIAAAARGHRYRAALPAVGSFFGPHDLLAAVKEFATTWSVDKVQLLWTMANIQPLVGAAAKEPTAASSPADKRLKAVCGVLVARKMSRMRGMELVEPLGRDVARFL